MLISDLLEKVQRTNAKKVINKKATEKWSFLLLLYCVQKFSTYTFFGELFCIF